MLVTLYSLQCQILLETVLGKSSSASSPKIDMQLSTLSPIKKSKSSDNVKHSKSSADESSMERFLKAIRIGIVCVCVVCNRCLYRSNVLLNKKNNNFEHIGRLVTDHIGRLVSFDNKHYICRTCNFKAKKSQVHVKQFIISFIQTILPKKYHALIIQNYF